MDENVVNLLADLQQTQKAMLQRIEKTPASTSNAVELHGVGSLFGSHSIEREVVSAHIRPFGLGARLPKIATVYQMPFFASITGFSADVGSEPAEPCDDAPRAYMKACDLTAQFGRVQRDTGTIEINDVMLRKNRGDFTDLMLFGEMFGESGFSPSNMTAADILNVVTKAEMVTAVISLERQLSSQLWNGSPANNVGAYQEFPGLSNQIATGQVDAHTNAACAALDSDVKDFGYQDVEDRNDLRDIVEFLSYLEAYLYFNAEHMGMLPLNLIMCLRPELWYVLSAIWPCAYNTAKCGVMDTALVDPVPNLDAAAMVRIRDDMRNGMYIDINGRRIPVVTDTGIFEHNNANNADLDPGEYASSIYMVPLSAGGLRTTYMEHLDYRAAQPDISLLRGTEMFWSDDAMYFWAVEYEKWCYKLSVKTEQRVVLRTPQLAGRIDSIKYIPTQHFRSPDPESPYFQDGGVSLRGDETTYHVW